MNSNETVEWPNEAWGPTNPACNTPAGRHSGFTMMLGSTNITGPWTCDSFGARMATSDIDTGTRTITLSGLPSGYECVWSTYSNSSNFNKFDYGCSSTNVQVVEGANNYVWYRVRRSNAAPTASFSPTSVQYGPSSIFKWKVNVTDPDPNGTLNIKTTLSPGTNGTFYNGFLIFRAYGTPAVGQYPIVNVYGWHKTTGNRTLLGTVTVNSTAVAPGTYQVPVSSSDYAFFDIEFTNDYYSGGEDRNLYVDYVRFAAWQDYLVQAEDSTSVFLDRGDSDDFYDIPTLSTTTPSGGGTFAVIAWGGSLRFPVMWKAPATAQYAVPGTISFDVKDNGGLGPVVNISTSPYTRSVTGFLWTTANPPVCSAIPASGNSIYSGTTISVMDDTVSKGPATVNSTGSYTINGIFGTINRVCISNLPNNLGATYTVVCNNILPTNITLGCISTDYTASPPFTTSTTINIGVKESTARSWVAALGGDVYASNYTMTLPPALTNSKLRPSFPSGVSSNYYVIGYSQPSSTIFSESLMNVGATVYSESNISATNLGSNFRQINKVFLQDELKNWVQSMKTKDNFRVSTLPPSFSDKDVKVLETSSIPNNYNYTVSGNGIAVLVVPANGSDRRLNISNVTANGTGRLMIITDRDVVIGESSRGSDPISFEIINPAHIQVSIITSGNITVANGPSPFYTLVAEGPLVASGNLTISRDPGHLVNELLPAFFVKYNPAYVLRLNNIAADGSVPVLKPLFTFDFSQEEK